MAPPRSCFERPAFQSAGTRIPRPWVFPSRSWEQKGLWECGLLSLFSQQQPSSPTHSALNRHPPAQGERCENKRNILAAAAASAVQGSLGGACAHEHGSPNQARVGKLTSGGPAVLLPAQAAYFADRLSSPPQRKTRDHSGFFGRHM